MVNLSYPISAATFGISHRSGSGGGSTYELVPTPLLYSTYTVSNNT